MVRFISYITWLLILVFLLAVPGMSYGKVTKSRKVSCNSLTVDWSKAANAGDKKLAAKIKTQLYKQCILTKGK